MSIRTRLIIMSFVVAILPAIPLSILVKTLLDKSFNVGLNTTVENALQSGLVVTQRHLALVQHDFEAGVLSLVGNGTGVTNVDAIEIMQFAEAVPAVDGVILRPADATLRTTEPLSTLVIELRSFGRDDEFVALAQDAGSIGKRPTASTAVAFFESDDHRLQLALWRDVLFYRELDAEFMANAERLLLGRQIFAQLRLTRDELSQSFFYPFMIVYALILLASLAIALLMAERLAQPIRQLVAATYRVAGGDWTQRISVNAGGEVGRLVEAFNGMVARLDQQRHRLIDMERIATWRNMARHLAHEIKNPLLPIRLTVQELKDQYKGDDAHYSQMLDESTRVIGDELDHLKKLVKEFSSFARMPDMAPRVASLDDLVRDVSKLYPQLHIRLNITAGLPQFEFDPDQMRRVLVNLFDNVVSMVDDVEAAQVTINLDRHGERIILAFRDNGPGMPAEVAAKVFDPYFTTRAEGSGLGLAMVKNIVLLHGGGIRVESAPGEGAAFIVDLPVTALPSNKE